MNLAEFHFSAVLAAGRLPYVVILALILEKQAQSGNWSAVCDAALLPYHIAGKAVNQSRWPLTAGAIAALLVIVALAEANLGTAAAGIQE
jgi:Ca-activated chloride channel family protein